MNNRCYPQLKKEGELLWFWKYRYVPAMQTHDLDTTVEWKRYIMRDVAEAYIEAFVPPDLISKFTPDKLVDTYLRN